VFVPECKEFYKDVRKVMIIAGVVVPV